MLLHHIDELFDQLYLCSQLGKLVRVVIRVLEIPEETPEIMHELIDRIVVHAPEGGRANRTQQVDIHFRFNVVTATATADFKQYYVRRKAV